MTAYEPFPVFGTNEEFGRQIYEFLEFWLNEMDPEDRAERIAYCRETGRHGVSVDRVGSDLVFFWAGRELCRVSIAAFTPDANGSELS